MSKYVLPHIPELSPDTLERLTRYILQKGLDRPTVFGDPGKVSIHQPAALSNALFNTQSGNIYIGQHVMLDHNVSLLTGTHDPHKRGLDRMQSVPSEGRDIRIEAGAWLASNVTVIGPVTIGENAVVAAGSLVMSDIPANTLYAGSPAKYIKDI